MTKNSKTGNPSAQHDITYLRFAQKEFKPKSTKGLMIRALYSESLRALKENKVIILQAPPGFGKQSLASYLHKKTNGLVIWITFTAKDNDPSIFIQKLTHALALSDIHLSPYEATHLQNTTEEDVAYIISQALLGINDVTFFFNDTHHLQHTFINTLLSVLLLNTTNSVRFLLSSIFPHSLNITSLAIHNQIHYVNIDTLRFNQTEATSLIGSSHKLLKYCQGWGAALTFIKHQQDQGLTIQESMSNVEKENQYIDHYFRENAFSNLSDEEEKTYIKLSTTDRFTLSQASEITNIHDLPRLTKIIEKQPFLLTTYVKGQQWFYYHNIFLHYLERLREQSFNNDSIDILREKSAHWLYKNTHYKAAIDTILLCQRYDTAALWLCDYTVIAKRKGNHEQLMVWLKQLPPTTLNLYPVLVAAYALCFILQKQWVQSDSNTLALSQATPKNDADKLQIERTAPLLMMASLVLKDNIETLTNIDPWITQWQQHSGFRTTNDYNLEMGLAKLIKGFYAKCRSQFTEGNTALNEARKLFEAYSSDYGIAWTDTVHTLLLAKQGLEFEALSKAVEGLQFIQRHLQKDIDIHHMLTALVSTMYYQQADFDNAKKYFPKDIELLQSYGFTDILIAAYKTQARFLIDDEKIQHAIDQLKKNIKHAESHSQHRVAFSLISELIVIMIHHDRGVEAKQYANAYDIGMDQTPKSLLLASLTYRARIYLLIDNQHFQKAQDIIEERIAIHIKQKRYAILAEYYRMLAVLHNKSDQPKDAELALQESLEISSSRHYLSLFNIDKKHLSDILNRLDSKKLSQNVRKFILKLQKTLLTPNTNQTQYVEKLTKKEILVIQLAESGDPTKHLAERLNISQGTLKWHLHNIYEKLHVKNRTQAIKSARDLGYL